MNAWASGVGWEGQVVTRRAFCCWRFFLALATWLLFSSWPPGARPPRRAPPPPPAALRCHSGCSHDRFRTRAHPPPAVLACYSLLTHPLRGHTCARVNVCWFEFLSKSALPADLAQRRRYDALDAAHDGRPSKGTFTGGGNGVTGRGTQKNRVTGSFTEILAKLAPLPKIELPQVTPWGVTPLTKIVAGWWSRVPPPPP